MFEALSDRFSGPAAVKPRAVASTNGNGKGKPMPAANGPRVEIGAGHCPSPPTPLPEAGRGENGNGRTKGQSPSPPTPLPEAGRGENGNGQANVSYEKEGRDEQGKFAKGNKLSPGNPFARQVAEARKAFLECGTPEEIKAIARAMIDKAKKGDVAAARVVLEYTIGKPEQTVAPDRLDQEEFEYFSATKGMYAEAKKLIPSVEPRLVLGIIQAARMGMTKEISDIMVPRLLGEVPGYEMPGQPSPNGPNGAKEPSPNGPNGANAPSPNGSNGGVEASANGKSPAVGG